ncbi:hypothetical protein PXK42_17360, partial [Phaeobacter gallaeciensis]|nr:hypothetical protein [Phaeobacter gallaeciensis]MDE4217948.1 hypothetical protein [Phaeobacter gallaeciensis]
LTASNTLADGDGLGAISYQWQRGGVDISGATGATYTLTQDDVGAVITVVASYTDGEGTGESVSSAATSAVTNVNDVPSGSVSISGTAAEDETLTASNTLADEDGLGAISYQWQRGGVDISGATGATYTLTQDDVGAVITVVASYTDGEGTGESVLSAATSAVTNVNDVPSGSVSISGTAAEDETLTASNTLADEDGLGAISYQWQRGGVDISGATGATYTLTQDDVGAVITVVASYTDGEGTGESVLSAATSAVTNVNDVPSGSVSISGTATMDEILTASNTLADEDGLGAISYQWQRGGVDISGATGATYTLTQDDVGTVITVVASYTDGEGAFETRSSSATEAIRYGDFDIGGSENDDVIRGRYGDDLLKGGAGEDSVIGGWGQDTIKGNAGSDILRGWRGSDLLDGGRDGDTLYGGKGSDTLVGGHGDDELFGRRGDDVLRGGDGSDILKGGRGHDEIFGRRDDDVLRGGAGNDTVVGGHGRDTLFGRRGDDDLHGGRGNDTLIGGSGDDLLSGGLHADTFIFGRNAGNDTISDFGRGSDVVEISSGARSLSQIEFTQSGGDVLMAFADVTVLVENITVSELSMADHFIFT